MYLKILVLLYADDTVIFGTDAESFQHNLDMFYEYCQLMKFNVNYNKTKIMVFGLRNTQNLEFKLGEYVISIYDEFRYLGVIFSKSRSFLKAINTMSIMLRKQCIYSIKEYVTCIFQQIYK